VGVVVGEVLVPLVVLQVVLQVVCLVLWEVGSEKRVSMFLFGRIARSWLAGVA